MTLRILIKLVQKWHTTFVGLLQVQMTLRLSLRMDIVQRSYKNLVIIPTT